MGLNSTITSSSSNSLQMVGQGGICSPQARTVRWKLRLQKLDASDSSSGDPKKPGSLCTPTSQFLPSELISGGLSGATRRDLCVHWECNPLWLKCGCILSYTRCPTGQLEKSGALLCLTHATPKLWCMHTRKEIWCSLQLRPPCHYCISLLVTLVV